MRKKQKAEQGFVIIDNNNKIKMISSKLNKDALQQIIQKVPLNKRALLICLAAGMTAGVLLAIFR